MSSKQIIRLNNNKSKLKETPNDVKEGAIASEDAFSFYAASGAGGIVQNSYKLAPDLKFPVKEVQIILESTLSKSLKDKKYDHRECLELCPSLSRIIQDKVKAIGLQRYKLITVVHMGENRGQSTRVASRCLWNEKYDNYASSSYYGETIFAQATVFGIYLE